MYNTYEREWSKMAEEMNQVQQNTPNNGKMAVCKSCGAQIAKSAKVCPSCGAKNKKPIYKKPWAYIVLIVIIIICIVASGGGDEKEKPSSDSGNTTAAQSKAEYTTVEIETLLDDLSGNAYNAQQKWKNQYVTIEGGKISTIDASGEYFSIESTDDSYWLESILVDIPKSIRNEVMSSISKDASVTVKGKITDVGEVMGYTMGADEVIIH